MSPAPTPSQLPLPVHRLAIATPSRHRRLTHVGHSSAPVVIATTDVDDLLELSPSATGALPRLPEPLITRERLIERLDAWSPVTVLQGLRGAGKTALAASWLAAQSPREVTSLWVSGPGRDVEHELGLVLDSAGVPRSAPSAFTRLHTALVARPGRHRVVLVLDGVAPMLDEWSRRSLVALMQRHRHLHLLICTDSSDPMPALAAASAAVNTLTTGELAFDVDELRLLLSAMGRPSALAEGLLETTGGWPAIVRLMLDAMSDGDQQLPTHVARAYVRATLAAGGELGSLELAPIALADRIDTEMISDLCGPELAAAVVDSFERTGLGERRRSDDRVVLELPTLVRDVLRSDCVDREPDAARRFHGRLASWHAGRDRPADALPTLRHAAAARDWPLVLQTWDRYGLTLLDGHSDQLRAILRDTPTNVLDERPSLAVTARLVASVGSTDLTALTSRLAEQCVRLTNEQLAAMPMAELLYLGAFKLAGLRLRSAGSRGALFDHVEGSGLADRVSTEVATSPDAPALGERIAWFEFQAGLTAAAAGRAHEALRHCQRALERARAAGSPLVADLAAAHLALDHALSGRGRLAAQSLESRDRSPGRGGSPGRRDRRDGPARPRSARRRRGRCCRGAARAGRGRPRPLAARRLPARAVRAALRRAGGRAHRPVHIATGQPRLARSTRRAGR